MKSKKSPRKNSRSGQTSEQKKQPSIVSMFQSQIYRQIQNQPPTVDDIPQTSPSGIKSSEPDQQSKYFGKNHLAADLEIDVNDFVERGESSSSNVAHRDDSDIDDGRSGKLTKLSLKRKRVESGEIQCIKESECRQPVHVISDEEDSELDDSVPDIATPEADIRATSVGPTRVLPPGHDGEIHGDSGIEGSSNSSFPASCNTEKSRGSSDDNLLCVTQESEITNISDSQSNCETSSQEVPLPATSNSNLDDHHERLTSNDISKESTASAGTEARRILHSSPSLDEQTPGTSTESSQTPRASRPESASQTSHRSQSLAVTDDPDGVTDDPDGQTETLYRVPYYLENFILILNTVLEDEYYYSLFNPEDRTAIEKFQNLSEDAQKLYVRLFQRNYRWLPVNKIQYPKIAEDLTDIFQELVASGMLLDSSQLTDLGEILAVLPAPEVRTLAKSLKLGSTGSQKEALVAAILRHSREGGISAFFGRGGGVSAKQNMVQKRAKSMLSACYKLTADCRRVFMRVIMLFGLQRTRGDEDEDGGGQQFVFQMLMSTIGRIKYPEYTVSRDARVFKDRDALLRFSAALQVETDMSEAMAAKNYSTAEEIYSSAKPVAVDIIQDMDNVKYDLSLPDHLQVYTAGSVYTRILSQGVELLQYQKRYGEAVHQLEQLLEPGCYQAEYRGRWYDRLALNVDHHLKQHNKALDVVAKALADPRVRTGHRLSLFQRAQRICTSHAKNRFIHDRWTDFSGDEYSEVKEAPKVTIEGCRVSCGQQGPLYRHGNPDDPESFTLLKHVEDVALAHYKDNGYTQGIHGEGSTFRCLFALFLWDVIFCKGIPDTFYNPFQTCPLDWYSDSFYLRRRDAIEDRLTQIKTADIQTLEDMLGRSWDQHQDVLCMGMNWERFTDVDHAKGLVRCIGPAALAAILGRFARHMSSTTGGVPDLAVWNPDTGAFKMVEVKGPGDRLSTKQILWLDYLLRHGVEAEVCHVQAISNKKIRR